MYEYVQISICMNIFTRTCTHTHTQKQIPQTNIGGRDIGIIMIRILNNNS